MFMMLIYVFVLFVRSLHLVDCLFQKTNINNIMALCKDVVAKMSLLYMITITIQYIL